MTLAPDERLVVFASGKDRPASPGDGEPGKPTNHWETAVQDGSRATRGAMATFRTEIRSLP